MLSDEMMKQASGQDMLSDMNGLAVLPPLNNMPQWSRVNTLDKARYPKRVGKDLPSERMVENMNSEGEETAEGSEDKIKNTTANPARVEHLQKSITFLRHQHQEILSHLHEEIDHLKRSNKELQFKIVMVQTPNGSAKQRQRLESRQDQQDQQPHCASPASVTEVTADPQNEQNFDKQQHDEKLDELKVMFLEEEVKELRRFLREEKSKNQYLSNLVELAEKQKDKKKQDVSRPHHGSAGSRPAESESARSNEQNVPNLGAVGVLPFNATIDPLQVHPTHQPPRTPTLHECQVIMRHLHKLGDKQAHELNQLKCDLRDVLYSHKWSPDAYLLAKAYIADDDEREATQQNRLPRIPLRQPTKKLPDLAYLPRDAVSLPALKQTMGNKAVERRRRTQILQKARLHREVLH